ADGERLADPGVLPGDHVALEDLDALLLAVEDFLVDLDPVPDPEVGDVGFQQGLLDQPQVWCLHGPPSPFRAATPPATPRAPLRVAANHRYSVCGCRAR